MDDLTCQNCQEEYSINTRTPRLFPNCGHSFCSECIQQLIDRSDEVIRCPEDKVECQFFNKKVGISCFPLNFALYRLLKQRNLSSKPKKDTPQSQRGSVKPRKMELQVCAEHSKVCDLVCLTDKKIICSDCILFGVHKGHQYTRMKDFQKELKGKLSSLEHKFESLKYRSLLRNEGGNGNTVMFEKIELKRAQLMDQIKCNTEMLIDEIKTREEELKTELELKFRKFDRVTEEISDNSTLLRNRYFDISKVVSMIRSQIKGGEPDYNFLMKKLYNNDSIFESMKELIDELNKLEEDIADNVEKELDVFSVTMDNQQLVGYLRDCMQIRNLKEDVKDEKTVEPVDLHDDSNINTIAQFDTDLKSIKKDVSPISISPLKRSMLQSKPTTSFYQPESKLEDLKVSINEEDEFSNKKERKFSEELLDLDIDDDAADNVFNLNESQKLDEPVNKSYQETYGAMSKKNNSFFREKNPVNFGPGSCYQPKTSMISNSNTYLKSNTNFNFMAQFQSYNLPTDKFKSIESKQKNNKQRNTAYGNSITKRNFQSIMESQHSMPQPSEQENSFNQIKKNIQKRRLTIGNKDMPLTSKLVTVETEAEMDFSRMGLTDYSLPELLSSIIKNKKVKALNLSYNSITEIGFGQIIRKLASHPSLERIYMTHNYLDDSVFGKIEKWMKKFKCINYFNFQNCTHFKNMLKIKKYVKSFKKQGLKIDI